MEGNLTNIDKLLIDEQVAIRVIEDYMLRVFNANRNWEDEVKKEKAEKNMPKQTESADKFWVACMDRFEKYKKSVTPTYVREMSCTIMDGEVEHDPEVLKRISWYIDDAYSLDSFEEMYKDVEGFYLNYTGCRKEAREKFDKLMKILKAGKQRRSSQVEENILLLDVIELEYFCEIFDLKNKKICKLLPYLLTAFCLNFGRFKNNHKDFFRKVIFEKADCYTAASIKKAIKSFSKIFRIGLCSREIFYGPQEEKPSIFYCLGKKPYIMNADVLRDVFEEWCRIIPQCAHTARLYRLEKELDLQGCQLLFDYYVQNPEVAKESIPSS